MDEPWSEDKQLHHRIFLSDGRPVACVAGGGHEKPFTKDEMAAFRLRIVVCVNACAGIPNKALKSWLNPPEGSFGAPHGTWANQLAASGRQQIELIEMLDTLCNGLAWNIDQHPDVMNESDNEALQAARLLLKKFGGAA